MSKVKTAFFCQGCGYESPKWLGKCPSCNQWNTFVEEIVQKKDDVSHKQNIWGDYNEKRSNKTVPLKEVSSSEEKRIITKDTELNRVL
ncbi:MAG TPA: hypothetical protein VJ647_02565, partial [Chitinophagaceae bacterium]|nr:hypothetical protein [Chitinophagaceae bacterium]